jgi:hypothetical protein
MANISVLMVGKGRVRLFIAASLMNLTTAWTMTSIGVGSLSPKILGRSLGMQPDSGIAKDVNPAVLASELVAGLIGEVLYGGN